MKQIVKNISHILICIVNQIFIAVAVIYLFSSKIHKSI